MSRNVLNIVYCFSGEEKYSQNTRRYIYFVVARLYDIPPGGLEFE